MDRTDFKGAIVSERLQLLDHVNSLTIIMLYLYSATMIPYCYYTKYVLVRNNTEIRVYIPPPPHPTTGQSRRISDNLQLNINNHLFKSLQKSFSFIEVVVYKRKLMMMFGDIYVKWGSVEVNHLSYFAWYRFGQVRLDLDTYERVFLH